jgi:hypothetical protein
MALMIFIKRICVHNCVCMRVCVCVGYSELIGHHGNDSGLAFDSSQASQMSQSRMDWSADSQDVHQLSQVC